MSKGKFSGKGLLKLTLAGVVLTGLLAPAFTIQAQRAETLLAIQGVKSITVLEQMTTVSKNPLVTMQTVEMEPGANWPPHRHSGPVFGYVLEGEVIIQVEGNPPVTYKQGQAFYEPSGVVHQVTQNPSSKGRSRFLAVIIGEKDKPVKLPAGPQ